MKENFEDFIQNCNLNYMLTYFFLQKVKSLAAYSKFLDAICKTLKK